MPETVKCPMRGFEECLKDDCAWHMHRVYLHDEADEGCAAVTIAKHLETIGEAIEDKPT